VSAAGYRRQSETSTPTQCLFGAHPVRASAVGDPRNLHWGAPAIDAVTGCRINIAGHADTNDPGMICSQTRATAPIAFEVSITDAGAEAVSPSNRSRSRVIPYDKDLYKERILVERSINKIRHYHRVGTRYEKPSCRSRRCYSCRSHDLAEVNVNRTQPVRCTCITSHKGCGYSTRPESRRTQSKAKPRARSSGRRSISSGTWCRSQTRAGWKKRAR
jgi:hypothetical protein